jgi:hypothetical protein
VRRTDDRRDQRPGRQLHVGRRDVREGAELGFSGIDFYAAGRAGVLGRLEAQEVSDCFGFMEPGTVSGWVEQATGVMGPQEAAAAFMGCAYDWADQHLSDDVDWDRVAELLSQVIAAAPDEGLPLFRAWRELRNEIHVAAVRDAGLRPVEAVAVKSPAMAGLFGWSELPEVADEHRAKHDQAEQETNRRMATAFAGLDDAQREELVQLCDAAVAAVR